VRKSLTSWPDRGRIGIPYRVGRAKALIDLDLDRDDTPQETDEDSNNFPLEPRTKNHHRLVYFLKFEIPCKCNRTIHRGCRVETGHKFVRIGTTVNIVYRIACLQTCIPFRLKLIGAFPGGFSEETQLHHKFKDDHISGEWFRLSKMIRIECERQNNFYKGFIKDIIQYQDQIKAKQFLDNFIDKQE